MLCHALCACQAIVATKVQHTYGNLHAHIVWGGKSKEKRVPNEALEREDESEVLRVMHVTDAHVSLKDEDPPHTHRMYSAMLNVQDRLSGMQKHPSEQLVGILKKAKEEGADLIALGGDIINYPSKTDVSWLLQQLRDEAGGIPFIYTAGNHDWHSEFVNEPRYDSARKRELNSTLRPIFEQSATAGNMDGRSGAGLLYGHVRRKGVDVLFFDNSNYQIDDEQLAFARKHMERQGPALILLHMPLALEGVSLPPKEVCGRPDWGAATDNVADIEGRPMWPQDGNLPSTAAFLELVKTNSAPSGRIIGLLTGHVHRDYSSAIRGQNSTSALQLTSLACESHLKDCELSHHAAQSLKVISDGITPESHSQATGGLQYLTLDAAEGGYRMITVRRGSN